MSGPRRHPLAQCWNASEISGDAGPDEERGEHDLEDLGVELKRPRREEERGVVSAALVVRRFAADVLAFCERIVVATPVEYAALLVSKTWMTLHRVSRTQFSCFSPTLLPQSSPLPPVPLRALFFLLTYSFNLRLPAASVFCNISTLSL